MKNDKSVAMQMLSLLVMDFGYDEIPKYGQDPIRHQVTWSTCVEILGTDLMKLIVEKMVKQRSKESKDVVSVFIVVNKKSARQYDVKGDDEHAEWVRYNDEEASALLNLLQNMSYEDMSKFGLTNVERERVHKLMRTLY